jgi:hypothetical protein
VKAARAIRLPGRPRGGSLSVGSRLSDSLRLTGRPFGPCVRRPSPRCATVVFDSAGAFHYNPGHSRGQERGAIDEAVSLTSFDRSIRGAPLRPAPFQRRGCEPLSALLGPRGAFTEYRRSLTLSWSPAGTPESVSETARSAGRLSYALAGRELSRTLTCKPKDPGTPDPCESDAQQPESAFRRIQNLRACTRRPIKRVNR